MAGSKESQQRLAKSKKQGSEKQNKSSKQATVKTGKQSSGAFKGYFYFRSKSLAAAIC
jgi:hypothetical protein